MRPAVGLGLVRRIGQVGYRSERELDSRFGRRVQDDGRYAAQSYLEHHADALARRFDAGSYVTLTKAMMSQDVGRGRGDVAAALRGCPVPVTVAGVDSDRLYPLQLQEELARLLGADLRVVSSRYRHDGFLLEVDRVEALLHAALGQAAPGARRTCA